MQIISGKYKGRKLHAPKGLETRPTSSRLREAVFNICQSFIDDANFLDLFAGSGSMGFEALSRGALRATFVDNNRYAVQCLEKTATDFDLLNQIKVSQGDIFDILKRYERLGATFDIIYADPPYEVKSDNGMFLSQKLLEFIDQSQVLLEGGSFFLEESAKVTLNIESLHTLALTSSRKVGRSMLWHFQKREAPHG